MLLPLFSESHEILIKLLRATQRKKPLLLLLLLFVSTKIREGKCIRRNNWICQLGVIVVCSAMTPSVECAGQLLLPFLWPGQTSKTEMETKLWVSLFEYNLPSKHHTVCNYTRHCTGKIVTKTFSTSKAHSPKY